MNKKRWSALVGICLILMLTVLPFVSCCPAPDRGTYTVGINKFPKTNNPFAIDIGEADASHIHMFYEPLVWGVANGEKLPGLAETWSYDIPTMTWTMNIYEDAVWADHTEETPRPVTAADAKFTIEKYMAMGHGSTSDLKPVLDTITAVDDKTITFEMNQNYALFLGEIQTIPITPEHIWGEMTNIQILDEANDEPIGSGPFTLAEIEADSHVIYEAREDYWGGTFDVETVIKKFYGTTETQKLALEIGDLDATAVLSMPEAIDSLEADPNINTYTYEVNQSQTLYVNHRHEPWNLKAFRQAVSQGINRADLIEFGADGFGALPNRIEVAPFLTHAVEETMWPYAEMTQEARIAAANTALDAIPDMTTIAGGAGGYRKYKGEVVEFDLWSTDSPANVSCAEIVALNCKDMGIKMNAIAKSAASLVDATARQSSAATAENWECYIWSRPFSVDFDWLANAYKEIDDEDPDFSTRSWIIGWEHEATQDKFAALQLLPESTERDTLIHDSQVLMAEEEPVIVLYHNVSSNAYRTDRFTGQMEGPGGSAYGAVPGPGWVPWILALEAK